MKQAIIHWSIEGIEGHGAPMKEQDAAAWVRFLVDKFGPGTHWYVVV
jgi:hypothetical protein